MEVIKGSNFKSVTAKRPPGICGENCVWGVCVWADLKGLDDGFKGGFLGRMDDGLNGLCMGWLIKGSNFKSVIARFVREGRWGRQGCYGGFLETDLEGVLCVYGGWGRRFGGKQRDNFKSVPAERPLGIWSRGVVGFVWVGGFCWLCVNE